MPLPFLLTSSDGFVGGGQYTRHKGAILSGNFTATTSAGTLAEGVGGLGLVQPGTVTSTLGPRVQVVSTAAAAIRGANYVYITQTTAAFHAGSTAGAFNPPLSGMGAALLWDAGNNRLGIFSTVSDTWMFTGVNSTSTGTSVFTSS
jgi:hypothetical protein